MDTSLLDSKSPTRGRPTRNPEEWSSRDLPRTIESARFTTDQNLPEPIEGQNRPSIERVRGVERSQRETDTKNGPKYQLVRWSIDWEQFTWKPTLKELASTREYRLARWKGIRVGRSPDKSIGKTLSTGEWTDLILGRVRLEEEYEALKQYTWKSGTLDAEDTTLAAQLHPAHKTHHSR
jgi:hypothetical protein